jgi:hypothetical protein
MIRAIGNPIKTRFMRKQIQVSIASPCHEDWNKMHANGNGRFCDHCEKTVVDFTTMSDAEIFRILSKNNKDVCGRLTERQMDRAILQPVSEKKKTLWAVLFTGLLAFATNTLSAQKRKTVGRVTKIESKLNCKPSITQQTSMILGEIILLPKIQVLNEREEPISGVSVYVEGSLKRSITDSNGQLEINYEQMNKNAEISMLGYESRTINLTPGLKQIVLKEKVKELSPVSVTSTVRIKLGRVVAGGVQVVQTKQINRIENNLITSKESSSFIKNIYPNPVHPGAEIRIELPEGNYSLHLLNTEGKLFQQNSSMIRKGLYGSLDIPSTLPAGQYFVRAIDLKTGKQAVKSLLIAF